MSSHITADDRTFGERAADRLASFGGSWPFIGLFMAVLFSWIGINTHLVLERPFDPYPFILLNLILSCLAAIQAPIIMMSQNRQAQRDRELAQHTDRYVRDSFDELKRLHADLKDLIGARGE